MQEINDATRGSISVSSIITVPIGNAKFVYEMHRKVLLREQMHKKEESVGKLRVLNVTTPARVDGRA